MSRFPLVALALCTLALAGCSRDVPLAPEAGSPGAAAPAAQIPNIDRRELERMDEEVRAQVAGAVVVGRGQKMVEVPAGSVDALAAAIAQVGRNGIVLLKAGTHTESSTIPVTHAVTLLGEDGAELVTSAGGVTDASTPQLVPVLHIRASHVKVQNLMFRPASGDGNTAILVDRADHTVLYGNQMTGYQFGIMIARGDHSKVWRNTIVTNGGWQTGAITTGNAFGIVFVNGAHANAMENDVSNALFGIWSCGDRGTLAYNRAQGNLIGIIFCTVPPESMQLPDGSLIGADLSCQNWVAAHNSTTNNFTNGFLVIDNANNNLLANNASSGNGTYDIELTGDTFRFGFLTPASFSNTFIAGAYSDIEVKNCGNGNTIIGGALVDNTAEPCD